MLFSQPELLNSFEARLLEFEPTVSHLKVDLVFVLFLYCFHASTKTNHSFYGKHYNKLGEDTAGSSIVLANTTEGMSLVI